MLLVFNRLFRRIFRWLLVLRVKQTCVLCMQLYAQHLQGSYICSISKNEQNMRYMHKYITYATYAKTHQICNICKNISNMQNMQKHIKYAKYVKTYQICNICKKYKNMQKYAQSYHIWTLAYICAICARSGSTRKIQTGWCAYFKCFCIYLRYMPKNEEECIYIEGVSIFCMLVHMRTNMIFGTSTHASC